jgi:taurine--2-oxoglutarate transaminase
LELVRDRASREPLIEWQGKETLNAFFADALARGLHVFGRYNTVVIAPPLIAGPAEFDEATAILDAALTTLEEGM